MKKNTFLYLILSTFLISCSINNYKNTSVWMNPLSYNIDYRVALSESVFIGKVEKIASTIKYHNLEIKVIHSWKGENGNIINAKMNSYNGNSVQVGELKKNREYLFFATYSNDKIILPYWDWGYRLPENWNKIVSKSFNELCINEGGEEITESRYKNQYLHVEKENFTCNFMYLNIKYPQKSLMEK